MATDGDRMVSMLMLMLMLTLMWMLMLTLVMLMTNSATWSHHWLAYRRCRNDDVAISVNGVWRNNFIEKGKFQNETAHNSETYCHKVIATSADTDAGRRPTTIVQVQCRHDGAIQKLLATSYHG